MCDLFQHGAIRTTLSGPADYDNDDGAGFHRIEAREIDTLGVDGIISKIRDTVGSNPVYLSIDVRSSPLALYSIYVFKLLLTRLILLTLRSRRPRVPQKREDGLRASCVP